MCTKPSQIRPRQGVYATSNRGARRLALNPLVCPDTLWAAPVSRSCCGFTDCVEGSPIPSTRCLMAPCPVTRLSHVRETARPGGGRVCRPIRVACALLCGVPHVFVALSCSSWRQGWPHLFLPVYRALADCGLAGLPEQSSGPSPLVHVPDEGPAGRASNIGGRLLEIQ